MHPEDFKDPKEKTFLIECHYEYYCQGYEDTYGSFLVYAASFEEACLKLKRCLNKASRFVNHTVGADNTPVLTEAN